MPQKELKAFIDIAIKKEEESHDFYMGLCSRTKDKDVIEALKWMAGQELQHKQFLIDYSDGKFGAKSLDMREFIDNKIAENFREPEIKDNMSSADIFLLAAHREKAAHDFYTEFAFLHTEGDLRDMILRIANEEMKHKEKAEYLFTNASFLQTEGG